MTARHWTWTLSNWTEDELEELKRAYHNYTCVRYIIWGQEIAPTTGTPHLQGYLELRTPKRLSGVKKLPGFDRAHLEARRGERDQARTYCMKDGKFVEYGDWEAGGQGRRNDLRALMKDIKANPSDTLGHMEAHPTVYSSHLRFAEKYTAAVEKESTREFRVVEVNVLWGHAGTGKTRAAHEADPNVFTVNTDEAFPFDGYSGEKTILLDDFYGGIKYHNLLRILDGHQMRVNVKGGSRYACWNKVYITSNVGPDSWYKHGLTPALKRRLTNVTTFFCNEVGGNTDPHLLDEITKPDFIEI